MHPQQPIAFFDSGLGGISVLRETVRRLPHENYIYYGDSLHAPYGVRSAAEVIALCREAVQPLIERGIKALVIACNTATSYAISQLRSEHPSLIIIGTEPAIKPAAERYSGGRILVMATPMTVQGEKFLSLQKQYQDKAEIIGVACGGLMEFVEQGIFQGEAVERYLREKLSAYLAAPVDAIVLGCTHYPFLTGAIRNVVGSRPEIMDGSAGIAAQLARRLAEQDLLAPPSQSGSVEFRNSLDEPEILALSRTLLHAQQEE